MDYTKLAELLGILLGDGNLNKNSNCITIVGSSEEKGYYEKHVIPLVKSLFNVNPKLRKRNDRNAFYLDINSKKMMDYLSKDIGLVRGNKVNATVPQIIKNNPGLISHFLGGLFDTDGCLKFSKQTKKTNYYPRIRIALKQSKLALEVGELIKTLKFKSSCCNDKRTGVITYEISGKDNLTRWVKIIGINNPVQKTKYLVWKKTGFYTPRSSLESRLKALDLKKDSIL